MHKDNLALERDCDWGVPLLKPPSIVTKQATNIVKGTYHNAKRSCIQKANVCYKAYICRLILMSTDSNRYHYCLIFIFQVATHVISPLPHTYIRPEDIPSSYDPRSLKGLDMTTVNRNQHIPHCMTITHIVNNYI